VETEPKEEPMRADKIHITTQKSSSSTKTGACGCTLPLTAFSDSPKLLTWESKALISRDFGSPQPE